MSHDIVEAPPRGREVVVGFAVALVGLGALVAVALTRAEGLPSWLLLGQAGVLGLGAWLGVVRRRSPGAALGFARPDLRIVLAGIGTGVAIIVANAGVNAATRSLLGRDLTLPTALQDTVSTLPAGAFALALLGVGLAGPLAEEMLFRGLLFRWLDGRYRFAVAAILSAVAFSLAHAPQTLDPIVVFLVIGVLLAALMRWTQNLWAPTVAHAVVNSAAIVGALLLKG